MLGLNTLVDSGSEVSFSSGGDLNGAMCDRAQSKGNETILINV
jgi:hypothetical protein